MFNTFTDINLSLLPKPNVVEPLNFEEIFADLKQHFLAKVPVNFLDAATETIELESEPLAILLQLCAYRELNLRQRINDATRAVMLAFAVDSDLDHVGANKSVQRLVITPADETTIPPTPAVLESDEAFRRRIQLSPEGYSCAGPYSAYLFHALSADGKVKDISVMRPKPGDVAIYVLTHDGNGHADEIVLGNVSQALNAEDIRPLNDTVLVSTGEIVEYTIEATLKFYPGVHQELSLQAGQQELNKYVKDNHRLGRDITIAGIIKALKQEGVQDVQVQTPSTNLVMELNQAGWCTSIKLNNGGTHE